MSTRTRTEPIGYVYMADLHCPACAFAQGMAGDGAIDGEGNLVAPIAPWDEHGIEVDGQWFPDRCGDCGTEL